MLTRYRCEQTIHYGGEYEYKAESCFILTPLFCLQFWINLHDYLDAFLFRTIPVSFVVPLSAAQI